MLARAALEAKRNEGNMTPFGQNMDITELDHGQTKIVVFRFIIGLMSVMLNKSVKENPT